MKKLALLLSLGLITYQTFGINPTPNLRRQNAPRKEQRAIIEKKRKQEIEMQQKQQEEQKQQRVKRAKRNRN